MSEERTQTPSKKRRQEARERGLVARSAELSAAAGLLAAAVLLGAWGDELATGLIALVREPLAGPPTLSADPSEVVARLRHLVAGVAVPFGVIALGGAAAALAAHQAQVGGLWAPGLLAPDPSRLWAAGGGAGLAARAGRGAWGLLKTAAIVAVAAWAIHADWPALEHLGGLEPQALARAAARALRHLGLMLALATLALGLADFALQYRRIEALLRTTPEQHREDLRSIEGDPALRAQRRRIARAWRGDPAEVLAGASLVLTGPAGLTVVLAGGPPPRPVTVRSVAPGAEGARLRRAAESSRIAQVVAPALAQRLAQRPAPAPPLTAETLAELAALWPST